MVRLLLSIPAAGTKREEEESRVLSEPDPTSGMTELTPNKDGGGRKSDEETLGEASQLSGTSFPCPDTRNSQPIRFLLFRFFSLSLGGVRSRRTHDLTLGAETG